ncbi:hypothetical protein CORC01_07347 [Colletotrichum orchidophilum]|uniref:Uncharacterized protein n=1 Tax=Colletotrichum orchidophilum TaxID=1209926 RepID=A0A1G4B7N5_9PEZI|nr:uncharacterized protein CORC01_07347 [Colletotrichum orchidophilum]OHE97292.1 hypothetical protein CORC01_07347 [Colletotrichum orchidophilum]
MASEQKTSQTAAATPDISNYTTSPTTTHHHHHQTSSPPAIIESTTNSWKPSFERRQSWNQEDQKRALQMSHIEDVKTGPGFTERG